MHKAILLGVITYAVAVTASASIAIGSLSAPGIMAPRGMISGNAGLKLRGGADDSAVPTLKRVMSHQDIATEIHGEADTFETRFFAKDINEGEHRSLWHDLPLFEVDQVDNKPTGSLNFVKPRPQTRNTTL
ncbi:hypothetical protein T484DRAFT_3586898 [Baffinella frigidus]|nr:hypothetical protein T484DRAFT_3586898 [Cryptophyta sp. CCMP2293]